MEYRPFLDEKNWTYRKESKKVLNNLYVNYKVLIKNPHSFLKDG